MLEQSRIPSFANYFLSKSLYTLDLVGISAFRERRKEEAVHPYPPQVNGCLICMARDLETLLLSSQVLGEGKYEMRSDVKNAVFLRFFCIYIGEGGEGNRIVSKILYEMKGRN